MDFASHIQTSEDCISMNDMAKLATKNGIKIGRTRLFNFLREKKVLGCKDGHKNMPYQRYIDTQPMVSAKRKLIHTEWRSQDRTNTYGNAKGSEWNY